IGGPDKVIVNVGSVGQPRDRDPRTGWALYDTDTGKLTMKRLDYDINRAVARINQTGLPAGLGERLRQGK
ncbi:MAG: metallophosphoesterase family protein, partial [Planctomycetota bacterium]